MVCQVNMGASVICPCIERMYLYGRGWTPKLLLNKLHFQNSSYLHSVAKDGD